MGWQGQLPDFSDVSPHSIPMSTPLGKNFTVGNLFLGIPQLRWCVTHRLDCFHVYGIAVGYCIRVMSLAIIIYPAGLQLATMGEFAQLFSVVFITHSAHRVMLHRRDRIYQSYLFKRQVRFSYPRPSTLPFASQCE
jgi:hypothetical protein